MNLNNNSILEKIGEGYGLPVLSPIALRLRELASSETASVDDLASLVAKDPSFTARLLRLANSAFFGNAGQISTIGHAVMKVGFMRLRNMALSISLRDTFPMGKVGSMDYEEFWRSSLYRAIIARSLARTAKTCNPEEAFVAGLTLEIGWLIFFDLFVKGKSDSMPEPYPFEALLEWEQEQFGVNHRDVGHKVLKHWNFPEIILECQDACLNKKRQDKVPPLALLCDAARRFSYLISEKGAGWHVMFTEVESIYGIKSQVLTPLLASAFNEVQEISETLKVKVSREADLIKLLEKVHFTLQKLTLTMAKWVFVVFDGKGRDGSEPMAQYSLTERLQMVAFEIKKPLLIIREFIDNLVPSISPDSREWSRVQAINEEVKKVELAALLLK
ncbi:MAG: HDOD domain-containing protein [Nitrospirae bacterium]|nr:HDOD domain-containing protein [Nitrospirota bacterium]